MSHSAESEYVMIGRIRKVRGRHGEVAAEVFTDVLDYFRAGRQLLLSGERPPRTVSVDESWFHQGRAILKFRGFETIEAAQTLVGRLLQIPRSERQPPPEGTVYLSDLLGCLVIEGDETLGTVHAIEETGGVPLLEVPTPQGELLIPFAEEICWRVDVEKKEIQVRLPPGLKELNGPALASGKRKRVAGKPRSDAT